MRPGVWLLRTKQFFRHGLRGAWGRGFVRPRILKVAPFEGLTDLSCEIHVMTSREDWLDLCWALASLYICTGRRYALCVHEEGTVPDEGRAAFTRLFPDSRFIPRQRADDEVLPTLASYPRCLAFRRENHLSPKVFDFAHYLQSPRMFLLDSDVLFFNEPMELLRRVEREDYRSNTVNPDLTSAYTVDPCTVQQQTGVELVERFNSGLGLIHRASLRLDWIEEFLGLPGIMGHFWRIEQTTYALCSSRFGVELLPDEYAVYRGQTDFGKPLRHYVGEVRARLYAEGMPWLWSQLKARG